MKKTSLIYLIIFSTQCFSHLMAADTLHVGNEFQFQKIKNAIHESKNGDIIIVHQGEYYEHSLVINKSVQLIGINKPVINAQNKQKEIIIIDADSVTIRNFEIKNIGYSYLEDLAAIRVRRKAHFIIDNNKFLNTMFAIYLEYSKNGAVINNHIEGNAVNEVSSGNGIHAWYCDSLIIENNYISRQRDGIYFEFVKNSSISRNKSIQNLRYGLHFMFSNNDNYYHNEFTDNGAGVAVMFSKNITMYENKFFENWGSSSYGLLLKEIYDAEINNNEFIQNTIGIRVEGSSRINYHHNNFINNGWALKIAGGCYSNKINYNNFIGNSFDLSITSSTNDNSFGQNYWSEYNGYDLDRNGIGDVPYHPVKLFNYIVGRTPESLILLKSMFIEIINFSEKVSPVFTPANVIDEHPFMKKIEVETNPGI